MSFSAMRTGFTLLELLVVAALLTVAVGVATLNLHGMSDQARLQAAATQVGAVYRLAVCEAARSDRPRVLQFDRCACMVGKPAHREGVWIWSFAPRIELVSKVRILKVSTWDAANATAAVEPPWNVIIAPGLSTTDLYLELMLDNGSRGAASLDGITGAAKLRLLHDERE